MSERVQIGDCTLIRGDCLEVLPTLGPVDAVVTDPPYGIGAATSAFINAKKRGAAATSSRNYGASDWDDKPCPPEAIQLMRDCSKSQIIWGGNYFPLPPASKMLVWDKINGENEYADCELAWTNLPGAIRRISWLWHGMIRRGREDRVHPTQKPLGVMEWCLGFLPDAHTILDPFMGSGTTLVACARLGRKGIGIEIDEGYFETACRRVEEAYKQPDLFIAPPEKPKQEALL